MKELTPEQIKTLLALPVLDAIKYWDECERIGRERGCMPQVVRTLVRADLAYLLVRVCGRVDLLPCVNRPGYIDNQFFWDRMREVQLEPDGYCDLWAREHGKSSVITFGLTLQNVLQDPEVTIGIFSFTRPQAKAFLRTLMREIETNAALHEAFPDILVGRDVKKYAKYSEDDGVIVLRKSNPAEATIEAFGLEALPVGRHFRIILWDDIVVPASVTTTEQVAKTLEFLQHSYNLGTVGGKRRMAGTRYSYSDAYGTVIKNGTFKPRIYPGRIGGTEDGDSVLWDDETHRKKRSEQGEWIYGSQIMLDPRADAQQGFRREWLKYYTSISPAQSEKMNKYILIDSANSKKKGSDYTAMWVIGLGLDGNYYALDMIRDRLNLKERGDRLFALHRKWRPIQVRHERYGLMSDISHYEQRMELESYRFHITEVAGQTSKSDRIKRLIPLFENGRVYLPQTKHVADWQKNVVDLVHEFVESEYFPFPGSLHDDLLDSLARIVEPDFPLIWPMKSAPIYTAESVMPSAPAYAT